MSAIDVKLLFILVATAIPSAIFIGILCVIVAELCKNVQEFVEFCIQIVIFLVKNIK